MKFRFLSLLALVTTNAFAVQTVYVTSAADPSLTASIIVPTGKSITASGSGSVDATTFATYTPAMLPVSTATQAALNLKSPIVSPVFTGYPSVISATATKYGVTPVFSVAGPTALNSQTNSIGLSSHPTPGRALTVSGLTDAGGTGGSDLYAIGIDLHPILTATANNQWLVGLWVDPSGPNGESQFNPGPYTGIKTAGIYNRQSLNQLGYSIYQGDIVGGENGSFAVGQITTSPTYILGMGDIHGDCGQSYDIGSSSAGQSLTGLVVLPVFKNTATEVATRSSDTGIDVKVSSKSTTSNTLTSQTAIHIQDGIKDANTTISNKYGILIESISGGTTENYGIKNLSSTYTTGLSNLGNQTSAGVTFLSNTGWNPSGSAGSALRFSHGSSSGDTYSIAQAVASGNNSTANFSINPFGGNVGISNTSPGSLLEIGTNTTTSNGLSVHGGDGGGSSTVANFITYGGGAALHVGGDGSIGIGTFSPGVKFDVSGAGRFSGQVTSTVSTGTAPLVISSTTRVSNLNVATAGTADALTTARTINGTSFDGSANITPPVHVISYSAGTLTITGDDGHQYQILATQL